ncbi:MAG: lipid II-degrading bacteriocin [Kiritimatiellia bacterium]
MYEKFLMYFCFTGLAIVSPVWLFLLLKKADVRPLHAFLERLRKESPIVRFVLIVLVANLIVYGSTKPSPSDGDGRSRIMFRREFDNGFTEEERATGYALWEARTNETWDVSSDSQGVEIEKWKKRGAVNDRQAFLYGGYPFVHPDGILDFEDMRIDALGRTLGVVPEANWNLLPESVDESVVRMATNEFSDVIVTWKNPLLERDRDAPVSVRTCVTAAGDVIIKYDLQRASGNDEGFATHLVRNGSVVGTNFTAEVTSLRYYKLRPEDYREADPDGDGISTLDEVKLYHTDPRLADTDGDGVNDGEEIAAGSDPNVRSIPDAQILARVLASSTNETYASECEIDSGHLHAVKLWDGFAANRTAAEGEILFERTVSVGEDNGWRECFLSSRLDAAGSWRMEGLVLEWRDCSGDWRSALHSAAGDCLNLDLAEGSTSVTIRLRATESFVRSPWPMYLLCYAPTMTYGGCTLVEDEDGQEKALVVTDGRSSRISLEIDYSSRPSSSPVRNSGAELPGFSGLGSEPGDLLVYGEDATGSWLEARGTGVCQVPEVSLPSSVAQASNGRGADHAANAVFWAVILDPSITYGGTHEYSPSTLTYDRNTDQYAVERSYPVVGECEWRGWTTDASGRSVCICMPEVRTGAGNLWLLTTETSVADDVATGVVKVYGTEVWRGTARHLWDSATLGRNWTSGSAALSGLDTCSVCPGSCKDGKCDEGDGTSLNSVKFRTALGYPRAGQISGYLYFASEGPVQVGAEYFSLKVRDDANVTVTTNGSIRMFACADPRGRDVILEPIEDGVRLTVNTHADGRLEHTWEVVNENGALNRIRVRRISRQNNIMNDETFICADGIWSVVDNISGLMECLERTDGLNDPADGCLRETRTKYDAQGIQLDRTTVESVRIGDGENAVLRETYWEQDTGYNLRWRAADYWDDSAHGGRHGRVRMTWGNCTDWCYHDYDENGFETLTLTQRNGSDFPWTHPYVTGDGSIAGLEGVTDAMMTVCGYEPFGTDSRHRDDAGKVRLEESYVVRNGIATLVSRTWSAYTRVIVAGYVAIRRDEWRAADADSDWTDPHNAHSYEITFSETDEGVPFGLRGRCAESLDENGVLAAHSFGVAEGRVMDTVRKSYAGNPFPTYEVKEYDAVRKTLLRTATCLAADDRVLDECLSCYDEKNRLRSSVFSDGTSLTNAYSCCRLLWSRDRSGRTVLRSAVTGQDRQYYAEEESWLGGLSTNGAHRVVHHLADCLGRETNHIVSVTSEPGSATCWNTYAGDVLNASFVSYPYGGDDYKEVLSLRGKRTVRAVACDVASETSAETVYDADGREVSHVETIAYRGGRTDRTTLAGAFCRVETNESDYDDAGCRIEREIVDSSASGFYTNVVVRYDFLGRIASRETPKSVVSYAYRGSSDVIETETETAGDVVRIRSALFDACGEPTGWVQDGVSDCHEAGYACDAEGEVWEIVRDFSVSADGTTNGLEIARTLMTGRGNGLVSRRIVERTEGPIREIRREQGTDPGVEFEVVIDGVLGVTTNAYLYGVRSSAFEGGVNRSYDYDACGSLVLERKKPAGSDAWMPMAGFSYDGNGDLVERHVYTNATEGAIARYAYDTFGRVVVETDPNGGVVIRSYDGFGNVVAEEGAMTSVRRVYDEEGRLKSLSTTRDGTTWDSTTWSHEVGTGLALAKTYADESSERTVYTDDGLPSRVVKVSGAWYEFEYDAARRVCAMRSDDGRLDVVFGHDAFGRLSAVSSAVVRISRTLSDSGVATNETMSVADRKVCWERAIDGNGRIVGFGERDGRWQAIAYDGFGRLSGMTTGDVEITFTYDAFGQPAGYDVTLTNGLVISRAEVRDAYRGLVTGITNRIAGVASDSFTCGYDANGRLVERNGEAYGFGVQGQLVSYVRAGTEGDGTIAYTYDEAGNRLAQGGEGEIISANALNQRAELSYSADGGLLALDGRSFAYDAAGRLVSVSLNGVLLASYAYDPSGRRVLKMTGGAETRYYYDGWRLVKEIETEASGAETVTEYFWAAGERRYELLYVKRAGEVYVPIKDQHLNVIAYVDASGSVVARYAYDPFGVQIEESGSMAATFKIRYTSHYTDVESGLVYYGLRHYAPTLGAWVSRDPLEERGDANLYRFCLNDPVSFLDILGLLTYQEAFEHYKNGPDDPKNSELRTPKRISFAEIDTSSVSVLSFPQVKAALKDCKVGKTRIKWRNKKDNYVFTTEGKQKLFLGDVSLKLEGQIEVKPGGDWKFNGTLKCFDDFYDFNKSTHRGLAGEILTWFGRQTDGKNYWIEIRGQKLVSESGNCCKFRETESSRSWWY